MKFSESGICVYQIITGYQDNKDLQIIPQHFKIQKNVI